MLDRDAKALADLVPSQAGLKFCRCPKCATPEADDPMAWSIARPEVLTCRKCGAVVPDDKLPAKVEGKIPEEVVEVLPRQFHRYPYHAVETEKQIYPDERIFLAAKRDFEAREFLAKLALYAASAHRARKPGEDDTRYARTACALLVRFAQVYPSYATHHDRPGVPKFLDRADLPPPYRRDYGTAKWDWSGALDVPLNLVVAYALVRDDPAMIEAGKALGETNPNRLIERDLFRASAEFTRDQPDESSEMALSAHRGMLAVGRLLDDPALVHEAVKRLELFLARGFYHDGLWRLGDAAAHARVMGKVDGWIDPLLVGYRDPEGYRPIDGSPRIAIGPGVLLLPTLALAREATRARWFDRKAEDPEVRRASWPATPPGAHDRRPALLGGAGIARLGVGRGADALDVELRGLGDYGAFPSGRLALRRGRRGPTRPGGPRRRLAHRVGIRAVLGRAQRRGAGRRPEPARGDRRVSCHRARGRPPVLRGRPRLPGRADEGSICLSPVGDDLSPHGRRRGRGDVAIRGLLGRGRGRVAARPSPPRRRGDGGGVVDAIDPGHARPGFAAAARRAVRAIRPARGRPLVRPGDGSLHRLRERPGPPADPGRARFPRGRRRRPRPPP